MEIKYRLSVVIVCLFIGLTLGLLIYNCILLVVQIIEKVKGIEYLAKFR